MKLEVYRAKHFLFHSLINIGNLQETDSQTRRWCRVSSFRMKKECLSTGTTIPPLLLRNMITMRVRVVVLSAEASMVSKLRMYAFLLASGAR